MWGLVSVCFAAGACFYYFKSHENEVAANVMRDQLMQAQERNQALSSERDHLQASKVESENQLKTREDLVAEKEAQLAQEEAQLESISQQSAAQSQQNLMQAPMVRRFNDVIRKLGKSTAADVVERGGRPVLRVPNGELFGPADATLKPEGKALLSQLTAAINGSIDNFELRVVTYTDTDIESDATPKTDAAPDAKPSDAAAKPRYATSWDLTAARATTLGRYYRDQTPLPFKNVLVLGRGDSEPIAPNTGADHARNRRVEITVTPLPVAYHAPEPEKPAPTKEKAAAPKPAPPKSDEDSAPKEKPKKAKTAVT